MSKSPIFISIINQKGGVGKTTSATNISAFLSTHQIKTLLIDLDPQGNSTDTLCPNIDQDTLTGTYDFFLSQRARPRPVISTRLPSKPSQSRTSNNQEISSLAPYISYSTGRSAKAGNGARQAVGRSSPWSRKTAAATAFCKATPKTDHHRFWKPKAAPRRTRG